MSVRLRVFDWPPWCLAGLRCIAVEKMLSQFFAGWPCVTRLASLNEWIFFFCNTLLLIHTAPYILGSCSGQLKVKCLAQEHLISRLWGKGESYSFTFRSQSQLQCQPEAAPQCSTVGMRPYTFIRKHWHSWASGGSSLLLYTLNWDIWSSAY